MKKIILALALALGSQFVIAEEPKKETKKVCVDVKKDGKEVKDPKTGKTKQSCKEVKVHKKLEGAEKVPEPKKK
jgi:hypothetical protein